MNDGLCVISTPLSVIRRVAGNSNLNHFTRSKNGVSSSIVAKLYVSLV